MHVRFFVAAGVEPFSAWYLLDLGTWYLCRTSTRRTGHVSYIMLEPTRYHKTKTKAAIAQEICHFSKITMFAARAPNSCNG